MEIMVDIIYEKCEFKKGKFDKMEFRVNTNQNTFGCKAKNVLFKGQNGFKILYKLSKE